MGGCRDTRRRSSSTDSCRTTSTIPAIAPFISRQDALATQTVRGGSIFGIYPFSTYRRVEFSGRPGALHRGIRRPGCCSSRPTSISRSSTARPLFNNGLMVPLGVSFIQETTVFREYGPLSGSTMRLVVRRARRRSANSLSRQTTDADARYYVRLGANGVFAVRGYGFKSWGIGTGLHVLRRQLRDARVRLPRVPWPQGLLRQRRAPLPAHQCHGDAHRHSRRHPRRLLLQHRRRRPRRARPSRCLTTTRQDIPALVDQSGADHPAAADHPGLPARSTAARPTASASRPSRWASRCTSTGRTARCSTRRGKTCLFGSDGGSAGFRKAEVQRLDRVRLLGADARNYVN